MVIITKKPTELRSTFFYTGSREPVLFVVPGSTTSSPYHQVVQLKLWGAGGGGCDGGRLKESWSNNAEEEDMMSSSSGCAGGYVEASFDLPTGETLVVEVGGGGKSRVGVGSRSSDTSLLGGLGGYKGGKSGMRDRSSGGGGGGGNNMYSIFMFDYVIALATADNSSSRSRFIMKVCLRCHLAMEPSLPRHLEVMGVATQATALH